MTSAAADRMGGLDVLVSNAGVEYFGPLAGITEDDVRRMLDTNVAGQLCAVQAAVPLMTGGGRIVLMSSVSNGIAVYEHSLYAASKAAVVALARNLAPELAARTSPSTPSPPAAPPPTWPPRTPAHYTHPLLRGYDMSPQAQISLHASSGGWPSRAEIAAAIAFLVSPDAAYLNGATLAADGGWM